MMLGTNLRLAASSIIAAVGLDTSQMQAGKDVKLTLDALEPGFAQREKSGQNGARPEEQHGLVQQRTA